MAATSNGGPTLATGPERGSSDELVERVQRLTGELELISDPAARERAEALIGAVIELYGEGLERILATLEQAGAAGAELREQLSCDGVVASLMLIHGLYPVGLEQRVGEALDSVRPYMESHGGNVELLGIEDGVARIRLEGSCEGCPASASTLELAIKQALDEAAPDLEGLMVEGVVAAAADPAGPGSLELPVIGVAPGSAEGRPSWFDLDGVEGLADGELSGAEVHGVEIVVARVERSLLAFRDRCPDCDHSLLGGELGEGLLSCPSCSRAYFLPRAGRSLDDDRLQLAPVPLLAGAAGARVALL
jgi:Fe-S cluster biogenesis protein NfuA/nitrite reductase/ring-hydroxylating ferredoxin subunit